jgi:low temperature requirement protein LtrA
MRDESRWQRWARVRRSLWQPPRPHGEAPPERVVGPLELFYDLVVVVLVAQAAHHLAGDLTWGGLGEFTVIFTLVWIAWANGSLHHELHGHEDARARGTFLLQIVVLAAMGAFIPQAGGARGAAFAIAAGVLFAVLAVLWLLAARGDRPEYRRPSRLFVTGTAACALLLAGTALLPAGARVPAWGLLDVAYLIGYTAVILTSTPVQASALIVSDALTERFGAFTIIVLGETFTGVVAGLSGEPVSGMTLALGLVAVVVGFGAWWSYFDFAGQRRRRAVRDDAAGYEPAGLGPPPRPVPAARPYLRRRGGRLPRRRRGPPRAAGPRPRARPAVQHPLGIRRRPPAGQREPLAFPAPGRNQAGTLRRSGRRRVITARWLRRGHRPSW